MAVICWLSIHHASNMFHGCNESKIRDPKDFSGLCLSVFYKAHADCFWAIPGERACHFHWAHQCFCVSTPWSCSTPVLLPHDSPSNPSTAGGPLLGTLKTTGGQSGKGPLRQKMSCLTPLPPSLDSLLSVYLSITHPFHSLICSFIQQMKWTCTICHVFD